MQISTSAVSGRDGRTRLGKNAQVTRPALGWTNKREISHRCVPGCIFSTSGKSEEQARLQLAQIMCQCQDPACLTPSRFEQLRYLGRVAGTERMVCKQ